jgi:hypothetical protein
MQNLFRNTLLGLALLCFSVITFFAVIGYELCYKISLCYEVSSVFGIYNYVTELISISLVVAAVALYTIWRKRNSRIWIVFTFLWIPTALLLSTAFGGGSNGWIPTSPSSGYVSVFLSLVYLFISFVLLRGRSPH